jgi:acyl-CoA synthetase (AMP-forming)/AMP-acid ligase II
MILSTPETIRAYTRAGWWGTGTLLDLWEANVDAHPGRLALVDPLNRAELTAGQPQRWTYAEADARATRLAAALRDAGVARDDVVMVQLPNVVELPLVYLAALKLGAVVSPLPVQYRQHELRHTMGVVEPRAFITTTRCGGFDHLSMVRALRDEVPSLGVMAALAEEHEPLPDDVLPLRGILEADGARPAFDGPTPAWDANEVTTICWTSGTEAEPKGVPRSHNMWLSIAYGTTDGARLADGAVMLNPFPLVNMSGIGGMLVPWLQVAGTLVMHHPLSLPVFLGQIAAERAAYTVAPPVLLTMLLANEALLASADLSSMRVIGSGSAPLSAFMVEGWKNRFGIDVLNFFGSNEGIALVGDPATVSDPGERARYFPRFGAGPAVSGGDGWSNRAAAGMETRLVDPLTGEPVTEPDQPGELALRGPTLFPGYYRRPEMTARAFDADGFFRTGDLFEVPAERPDRLRFVGRARDLIIRGGMKVAPEELESLIATHPAVAEVAVVGIEERRLDGDQRICVVAALRPGTSLTVGELRTHLAELQIAAYKMPKQLLVVDALPRNPVGKVLKRDLRMRLEGRGGGRSVAESEGEAARA